MSRRNSGSTGHQNYVHEKRVVGNNITHYERHRLGQQLGKGGFATCYVLHDKIDGMENAVKVIPKKEPTGIEGQHYENKKKIQMEIDVLNKLSHPNIVRLKRSFEDDKNVYIVMELCRLGSLNDLLKKRKYLSQPEVKYMTQQIVEALKYLRTKRIIHRDIKLANFFIQEGLKLKLGDFGLFTYSDSRHKSNVCGTPNYIAPEILDHGPFNHEADLWSTGVLIFTLLLGTPPFETKSTNQTYARIKKCQYSFKGQYSGGPLSNQACDFIRKILVCVPKKRLKLDEVLDHPWMSQQTIPGKLLQNFRAEHPNDAWVESFKMSQRSPVKYETKEVSPARSKSPSLQESKVKGKAGTLQRPIEVKIEDSETCAVAKKRKNTRVSVKFEQKQSNSVQEVKKDELAPIKQLQSSTEKKRTTKKIPPKVNLMMTMETSNPSLKAQQLATTRRHKFKLQPSETRTERYQRLAGQILNVVHCQCHIKHFGIIIVFEDHSFCFAFNDHSKFKVAQDHHHAHYIFRKDGEVTFQESTLCNLKDSTIIGSYKRKVILSYTKSLSVSFPQKNGPLPSSKDIPVYTKVFQLTQDAIVCKLSDSSIQAFFKNQSRLIWAPTQELVIDRQENGPERHFSFRDIPKEDEGIKKRLLEIRDFLRQFGVNRSVYDDTFSRKTAKRRH